MKLSVSATRSEVEEVLREKLSASEFEMLEMKSIGDLLPFQPSPRRLEPTLIEIMIWVGGAVGSGLTYDAIKVLTFKARDILRERFGKEKVRDDDFVE